MGYNETCGTLIDHNDPLCAHCGDDENLILIFRF